MDMSVLEQEVSLEIHGTSTTHTYEKSNGQLGVTCESMIPSEEDAGRLKRVARYLLGKPRLVTSAFAFKPPS